MQSQPQPIVAHNRDHDYNMAGSYTGSGANGSFNPASYTRHFLGSPISWRATSFGSQFYDPNVQVYEQPDLKRMSSSYENERGTFFNAISAFDREGDLCRNYTCCGLHLNDLHALLEHFEEVHVVVVDPTAPNPQTQVQIPFNPQPAGPLPQVPQQHSPQQQQPLPSTSHATPQSNQYYQPTNMPEQIGPFDPDDMDIGLDPSSSTNCSSRTPSSGAPTPPDTPISTPQFGSYSNPNLNLNTQSQSHYSIPAYHSQPPSPSRISAFDTTTVVPRAFLGAGPYGTPAYLPTAALGAGNSASINGVVGLNGSHIKTNQISAENVCGVPPALLFSNNHHHVAVTSTSHLGRTNSSSAHVTPNPSRVPSPSSQSYSNSSPPSPTHAGGSNTRASSGVSRPSASMLLSKPFKCPKPNCNKSYKQANGLKYHITHGQCNFAPAREVEQVQALLAARSSSSSSSATPHQKSSNPSSPVVENPTEEELREVEREAEKQLRPFACGVADCTRRYKNMNGLRYHYQHSGEHGTIGLALLASGQHEACARNGMTGVGSRERRSGGSRAPSRASTPPGLKDRNNEGHSVGKSVSSSAYQQQQQQFMPFAPGSTQQSIPQQQQARTSAPTVAMPVQMGYGMRYDSSSELSMGIVG